MAQTHKEYQLVQYTPLQCSGMIPPPLPKCLDLLPAEKKAQQEKERDDKRRKQAEINRNKKKSKKT